MCQILYQITWDNEELHPVTTIGEVEELLDLLQERFRKGRPTLVTVERFENGDCLIIGLGLELSVLNYVRGDKNPPYYTSSGDPGAVGAISFRFGGELSEFWLSQAVPVSIARAAMTHFCETGELSKEMVWEMD